MKTKITIQDPKDNWRELTKIDFIFMSGETLVCHDEKRNKPHKTRLKIT